MYTRILQSSIRAGHDPKPTADTTSPMGRITDFFDDLKVVFSALTYKAPPSDAISSFGLLIEENAAEFPDRIALLCESEKITWSELNALANRVAHVLKQAGIMKGDCVSLFMQNRVEYLAALAGICKLGAIGGLINTNLKRTPLVHCINLIDSRKLIVGEEVIDAIEEVKDRLAGLEGPSDYLMVHDQKLKPAPDWVTILDTTASATPPGDHDETQQVAIGDRAFYIFTSGTTGLPKAAVVTHKRALSFARLFADLVLRLTAADRLYNCLPLYHGTGLMVGFGSVLQQGCSMVIRRKLSVSAFWDDIRRYRCTGFVYIGEFIRYLLSVPPQADDAENPVTKIVGNGLRPDIWMAFKERFQIDRIGEFYGASEGNSGFANVFNNNRTVGVGISPALLISYDVDRDEIDRDDRGFCIPVREGDPGLLLFEITDQSQFDGYTSEEESDRKIIRHVLRDGDAYFNSGDLMRVVSEGFSFFKTQYQFVDRMGDTYRWKSENVSTNDVSDIINQSELVEFSTVYGVEIPDTDGKAGMAAIVPSNAATSFEGDAIAALGGHIVANLPRYARPVFLRILEELPTTSTFKLQKTELGREGYDPSQVEDELWVMLPGEDRYERLDDAMHDRIAARELAF